MVIAYEVVILGRRGDYQEQALPDSLACLGKVQLPATTIWVTGMTYEPDGAAYAPSLSHAAWETDMLTTLPVQSKGSLG